MTNLPLPTTARPTAGDALFLSILLYLPFPNSHSFFGSFPMQSTQRHTTSPRRIYWEETLERGPDSISCLRHIASVLWTVERVYSMNGRSRAAACYADHNGRSGVPAAPG
jgi:hypothetical protein